MFKKIIICLFALGLFLLPCLVLAAESGTGAATGGGTGTLVITIKDAKGRNPASELIITNTSTNKQTIFNVGEGVAPAKFDLPAGGYKMLVVTDQEAYDVVPEQPFAIADGQEQILIVTPSFASSVFTGGGNSSSGGTSGTVGTADTGSPSGTGTGSSTAKASGTLSIGSLSIAAPAIFTDLAGFGDKFKRLETALPAIFDIVIYAAGIIFVVLFLVGGIQYLSSAGNEEATGKAKKMLVDAVIGLIIVLASWAIGTWILTNLGVK